MDQDQEEEIVRDRISPKGVPTKDIEGKDRIETRIFIDTSSGDDFNS